MKRRNFVHLASFTALAAHFPMVSCKSDPESQNKAESGVGDSLEFMTLSADLLTIWCDGMIAVQVDKPEDPTVHGALYCPACDKIHGRCMDAVYPFLYMADTTGKRKYLNAALDVMEWSKNVSMPDGSWTVVPDPKSWKGITVFGAIALGEALHHHGHVLPEDIKSQWTDRLRQAAEFVHKNFTIDYSHVNYAFTAVYALNFLGRMFDNEGYLVHSRELAAEVPKWLTQPNKLIFGENKPADGPSAKGLMPVDLGYNVEETLNGLVQYALLEKDEELLKLLQVSMESHMEFMLPDGAWDNSWGTRQNKWSYWGSRTTDGCQPAFCLMSSRNPQFGTAAFLNTELLKRCTVKGLLAGGPHYGSHGVEPCVHHSFAHAKSLAFVLDNSKKIGTISKKPPVPRAVADGIRHFPEIDVWLAARGPWRATVSAYDAIFKKQYSQAATGGALSVLWHERVGPICMASMAEYILAEVNNQQPQPDGEDIPLTPRIERTENGTWFSNLFDLETVVTAEDENDRIRFGVETNLTDRERNKAKNGKCALNYSIDADQVVITAALQGVGRKDSSNTKSRTDLVIPIISPATEQIISVSENRIEILKPNCKLTIESNVRIKMEDTKRKRTFNMVPGMQAVPLSATFPGVGREVKFTISVD